MKYKNFIVSTLSILNLVKKIIFVFFTFLKRYKKIVISVLFAFWTVFVIGGYFLTVKQDSNGQGLGNIHFTVVKNSAHQYFFEAFKVSFTDFLQNKSTFSPIVSLFFIVFFIYFFWIIYRKFLSKKGDSVIKIKPIIYLVIFLGFLFINYFIWLNYYYGNQLSLIKSILPLLLFKAFFEFLAITFVTLSFGRKLKLLLTVTVFEKNRIINLIISFGLGVIGIELLFFLLGVFGQLKFIPVIILFSLALIFSYKEAIFWIKNLFIASEIKVKSFSPTAILIVIFLIFLSYNLISIARPFPIGHDELEAYMNTSHLLGMSGGHLVNGISSYPWELFVSSAFIIFNNTMAALMLSASSGIFLFFALIGLGFFYCKKRGFDEKKSIFYPILIATLFYTLPATTFQLSNDMKVDLIAMFFAILAFLMFWVWEDQREKGEKKANKYLYISAFLLGFAFVIKLTLIFITAVFIVYLLIHLWKNKFSLKKSIMLVLLCIAFFLIPYLPFIIKNNVEIIQSHQKWNYVYFLNGVPDGITINYTAEELEASKSNQEIIASNGNAEVERYGNFQQGFLRVLKYPFIETFGIGVSGQYVDIGFLFLLLIPLSIIGYKKLKLSKDGKANLFFEIMVGAILYWLLWALFAKGVIWYGFPGFIFFLLLLIEVLEILKKGWTKYILYASYGFIAIWFVINLILRSSFLPNYNIVISPYLFQYNSQNVDEKQYLYVSMPRLQPIVEPLNNEIAKNKENPPKIYLVGKYTRYYIDNNDKLVFTDDNLAMYYNISQGKSDQEVIDRFKSLGFNYLVIGRRDINFFGSGQSVLQDRFGKLLGIIANNPTKIQVIKDDRDSGMLFAKIL